MIGEERLKLLYEFYIRNYSITTDSRQISQGSIFFALRGNNFDGNRFAVAALEKGASLVVADDPDVVREFSCKYPNDSVDEKIFLVEDVLEALQSLASYHRKKLAIPIIAITGTNGKTTTKELVTAVLSKKYKVHSTRGNFNNHIGVPITILSMRKGIDVGVVEMGASAKGEIATLCAIASPDYGLITNIGSAHLDGFGGEEGVKIGKGELYDYLSVNAGIAFVREDDHLLKNMAEVCEGMNIVWYDSDCADKISSNLFGAYNRFNVAAAVTIGRFLGVEESDIKSAIESYKPDNNRSQVIRGANNVVVADCYNANPTSMSAAIDHFSATSERSINGEQLKKMLILGDMKELGEWSANSHKAIAEKAIVNGIDTIYFVGRLFKEISETLSADFAGRVAFFESAEEVISEFKMTPPRGYYILVKGSNSVCLDRVLEYI